MQHKVMKKAPMTDVEAARHVAHVHPLTQQSDENPEDFVLRIVRVYDEVKSSSHWTECADLADCFLQDEPHLWNDRRTEELARLIQQTIEDFIAQEKSNYEPPDPPGFEGGFAPNH